MALQNGPLTGAPVGIPTPPLTDGSITLYEMLQAQSGFGATGNQLLLPIFESPVRVSGDFAVANANTLTCQKAGDYLVSANISVVNDGGEAAINKQANFECTVNGGAQSSATVSRAESPMNDGLGLIARTIPLPASTVITLAVGDEVQFWFSYQPSTPIQTYDLDTYSPNPGALAWAQLERVGAE